MKEEIAEMFSETSQRIKAIEKKAHARLSEMMAKELGREPTAEELAQKLEELKAHSGLSDEVKAQFPFLQEIENCLHQQDSKPIAKGE
jgi:DNA-directed RNA polymerase sigma subunit (sigma70/sigma32)